MYKENSTQKNRINGIIHRQKKSVLLSTSVAQCATALVLRSSEQCPTAKARHFCTSIQLQQTEKRDEGEKEKRIADIMTAE